MKKLVLVIAAISLMATAANATILWDQSNYRTDGLGFWNSVSPGFFGGGNIYGASDFTLAQPSVIESVTTYYTNTGNWAPGAYTAKLAFYVKTGPLPDSINDLPALAVDVPVTLAVSGGVFSLTASGLVEGLAAGDYWVALTPDIPAGVAGIPEFQLGYDGATIGDVSCQIEFGGFFAPEWFPSADSLDGAMLIEGTSAVDNEVHTFGGIKSIYR